MTGYHIHAKPTLLARIRALTCTNATRWQDAGDEHTATPTVPPGLGQHG